MRCSRSMVSWTCSWSSWETVCFRSAKFARHLADGDLALFFMLLRLNRIVARHFGESDHVGQRGLPFRVVAGNIKPVGGIKLQFGYANAQRRTILDTGLGDAILQFLKGRCSRARAARKESPASRRPGTPPQPARIVNVSSLTTVASELLLRLDGNEPMFRLPLLIRILPIGSVEEEVKVCGGVLKVAQVIVSRRSHEICDRSVRQQLCPRIQRPNHHRILLVLAGRKCQIAISLSHAQA